MKEIKRYSDFWHQLRKSEVRWAYIFILPAFSLLLIFLIIPIINAFWMGFTNYGIGISLRWVGLQNYEVLFQNKLFWKSLANTAYFSALIIPLGTFTSLMLALLVNMKIRGIAFFRTAYFIPVVTSLVVTSLIWQWILDPSYGLLNHLLKKVGLPTCEWLKDPNWAMPSIVLMTLWYSAGYEMLIFLAGLQGIPKSLYESARIDGANKIQSFWHITVPLLKPVTFYIVVMYCIWAFQLFTQVYITTKGGPLNSTTTVVYQIYIYAFRWFKLGYAASWSFVLAGIIFILTLINMKVFKEK